MSRENVTKNSLKFDYKNSKFFIVIINLFYCKSTIND